MRRALAVVLAAALVSAVAQMAPAMAMHDEASVRAADAPDMPGEPAAHAVAKVSTAEVVTIMPFIAAAPECGSVYALPPHIGRGELHARLLERPPRAVCLHLT